MKFKNKNLAFTLVELIVVITILAVLGTIAFLSFQGYSRDARDSKRISDINIIETGIELFLSKTGKLPVPDNSVEITYSGSSAWFQGTFGDNNVVNLSSLSEKPTDPLSLNEYTYSKTANGLEYEIAGILEGSLSAEPLILANSNISKAASQIASAYVVGNYNQKFLRTINGSTDYLLAVPSIISNDITDATLENILSSSKLVFGGHNNLPSSYNNTQFITNPSNGFAYSNSNPVIFSGSVQGLTDSSSQQTFVTNLKNAYSGSIFENKTNYADIVNIDINSEEEVNNYVFNITINNHGGLPNIGLKSLPIVEESDPYSLPSDLAQMFSSNSAFTSNWSTNSCDPSNITVVEVSPGLNTIPSSAVDNTIYKLESGEYENTLNGGTLYIGNCSGIIGEGVDNTLLTARFSLYSSDNILFGFSVDGDGATHGISKTQPQSDHTIGRIAFSNVNNYSIYDINNAHIFEFSADASVGRGMFIRDDSVLEDITLYTPDRGLIITGDNISVSNVTIDGYRDSIEVSGLSNSSIDGAVLRGGTLLINSPYSPNTPSTGNTFSNFVISGSNSGIELTRGTGNIFNNFLMYDNSTIIIQANGITLNETFNNFHILNSTSYGIRSSSGTNGKIVINNSQMYNLNSYHIENDSTGDLEFLVNNSQFYNNFQNSLNEDGIIVNDFVGFNARFGYEMSYYGDNYIDDCGSDESSCSYSGPTQLASQGIFTEGSLGGGTFDASTYTTSPVVSGWNNTLNYKNNSVTLGDDLEFSFGEDVLTQKRPIRYNSTSSQYELYGTDGVDYDSTKFVGEQ